MKKHLTPNGWKPCSASEGNCKYHNVEHMDTSKVTLTQVIEAQKAKDFEQYYLLRTAYEQEQGRSIHTIEPLEPSITIPAATDDSIQLTTGQPDFYGVDYSYDDRYNHEEYGCSREGICRCRRIYNVQIHDVKLDEVVEAYVYNFQKLPRPQQEQLRLIAISEGAHEPSNYEANVIGGYYGDEVGRITFANHGSLSRKIQQFAIASPNYSDDAGILKYVRAKGTPTAGLTPLQAIKEQLAQENNGKILKSVTNAKTVTVKTLRLADIDVPHAKHYEESEARPIPKNGFAGVVILQNGRYRLLDGYHRLKDLHQSGRRVKAKYLILQ